MGSRPEHSERELATAFLASVSHELRTPLNAVLGMLELSLDEPLSSTVRDYLITACDSARTLATNLNLMLEFAQFEIQPLPVSDAPLDFRKLAERALQSLATGTQQRVEIRLDPHIPAEYCADESQLQRVISTLTAHAARWLEHPRILLEFAVETSDDDATLLKIGISEYGLGTDEMRAAFVPFDPVETSKYASAGLALSLARRWLDRVGGQLLTDSLTAGGRFYVQVPVSRVPPRKSVRAIPTQPVEQQQQQQSRLTRTVEPISDGFEGPLDVLVVDDTEANQKVVKAVLAKRGHRVELAENGQQAVDHLRRRMFDVVLMDAQMPLMNGFEATAAIRRLPESKRSHVPIIAMTAHALQEDRLKCLAAGMDDYLAKPIDVATLVAHVEFYGHSGSRHAATANQGPAPSEKRSPTSQDFLAGARARLAGDEELLLELIRLFRKDACSLLEKVAAGLQTKDAELASRAAHNLRGLAASFDDARTISAAGSVEKLALSGEFDRACEQLEILRVDCNRLIEALDNYEKHEREGGEA